MEPRKFWLGDDAGAKLRQLGVALLGLVLGQFVLYGPSLLGRKVLLPLDILAQPGFYIPATPENPNVLAHDPIRSDLIVQLEPDRRFATRELHHGRFPHWNPLQYGGVPFIWPKYSPFFFLTSFVESPRLIAWSQFLAALVAGVGAYAFARRVLGVGFWPAALTAWCYPLTGFFILWQGYATCAAVYWLPWLLWAVDASVRLRRLAVPNLAAVTGLVLVSGHVDVAMQTLLVSGIYAVWRLWEEHRFKLLQSAAYRAVSVLVAGWILGFALGAPQWIPVLEYSQTGERIERRGEGFEERPPIGIVALPQTVLPDMYGNTMKGSAPLFLKGEDFLSETPAAAYAGLLATLVAAPLAWFSRRHRSAAIFWTVTALLGLSWCLNVPGVVQLLRLPALKIMSHNRLVFATAFAIVALAAIGLDVLFTASFRWRRSFWIPATVLGGLMVWCFFRAQVFPEPLASGLSKSVAAGQPVWWIQTPEQVRQAQDWFSQRYAVSGCLCAAGVVVWLMLWRGRIRQPVLATAAGVLLLGELLWFSRGRSEQCDFALWFPEVPALTALSNAGPTRVIGYNCLPAKLAAAIGLRDVRGYDGIDPSRWIGLVKLAADPRSPVIPHAATHRMVPQVYALTTNGTVALPPVLNLLGVTHVIFRGNPPAGVQPVFQSPDYWILQNASALPRVFVPQKVETVDTNAMLQAMSAPGFDPRKTGFLETDATFAGECLGNARIISETPTHIRVQAQMETAGLLVLTDMWEKNWRAFKNREPVPILKANYALRGIVLPKGSWEVEFRYQPQPVNLSLWLAGGAATVIGAWFVLAVLRGAGGVLKPKSR